MTEAELLRLMEESWIGMDATKAIYLKAVIGGSYTVEGKKAFKPTELEADKAIRDDCQKLVTPDIRRRGENKCYAS